MSEMRCNNDVNIINIPGEVIQPSVSIAPYEHSVVYEYLGKNRYLQASFYNSVQRLYSDKFGPYTTKYISNIAAEEGFIGLLEWSKEVGCRWDQTLYIRGAMGGKVDVLRWLVNNGCPVPYSNMAWTAAAERGHLEVLKFAYESKYIQSIKYMCEVAAKFGHLNILTWIREVEGNKQFDADTCRAASENVRLDVLQYLRSIGCEWDGRTCDNAICHGHAGVLKWALDNGCPWGVHDRGINGKTGLHYANNAEVIELLISLGADINAVDKYNQTPIYWAARDGSLEAVKTFVRLGADVNIANVYHHTPLDVAIARGHLEIVEVLRAGGAREST